MNTFVEELGNGITLEMALIPGGSFLMGAPEDELERHEYEGPQHHVTIQPFYMGKYLVTQAQWKAVAALSQVNQELDPAPAMFKGSDRPIECVSWYEAVEFCDRLSRYSGRSYRLPSEAEWEYACRARTTTPFHFGETITTDLANYNGTDSPEGRESGSYGKGPKGIYRQATTPVGSFQVANAFGLYDMHGNLQEWCLDNWYHNYAWGTPPTDGSAWLYPPGQESHFTELFVHAGWEGDPPRVVRGGSWYDRPRDCRSAAREMDFCPWDGEHITGFRIVCSST